MGSPVTPADQANRLSALRKVNSFYKGWTGYSQYVKDESPDRVYVPGRGSMEPHVVFVVDHPSVGDTRTREPLTGAPGRVFDSLLHGIGWTRDQVYVTHLVKWAPMEVLPEHRSDGLHSLAKELTILGRPPVVAVGAYASEFLLPQRKWTDEGHFTNRWYLSPVINAWVLCVRHPTIGNYQKVTIPELVQQFQAVRQYAMAGFPTYLIDTELDHVAT